MADKAEGGLVSYETNCKLMPGEAWPTMLVAREVNCELVADEAWPSRSKVDLWPATHNG